MRYPNIDELLDQLNQYEIQRTEIPIYDHTYVTGDVNVRTKKIRLNRKNSVKGDIDTVSHELYHIFYDGILGIHMPETEIERLSQVHLATVPEYHDTIERKILEVRK